MKSFNKTFVMSCVSAIALVGAVAAGQAAAQTNSETGAAAASPADAAQPETVVVVTGMRGSLTSARSIKRSSGTMVDSIVAEDIGKFPDNNVVGSMSRIPGIQISRREGEGSSIKIRGVSGVKTAINDTELFGWNNRDFSIADMPSDVVAGVDVYKGSEANQIEGGLGGYVNVRTRRPFDSKKDALVITVKASDNMRVRTISDKITPSGSILYSHRFDTSIGEMGFLVNVSKDKIAVSQDRQGSPEGGATRSNFAGVAGNTVNIPNFVFLNASMFGTHERDAFVGSFQWRPTESLEIYADAISIEYNRIVNFSDFRITQGAETSNYQLFSGTHDLKSGDFTNDAVTSATVASDFSHYTRDFTLGAKWNVSDRLNLKATLSRIESGGSENLYEWAMSTNVPLSTISIGDDAEVAYNVHGYAIDNPSTWKPNYLLVIDGHGEQAMTEFKLDGNYKVDRFGIKSVDAGWLNYSYDAESWATNYFNILGKYSTMEGNPYLDTYASPAGNFVGWNLDAIREQSSLRGYMGMPLTDSFEEVTGNYNGNFVIGNLQRYSGYSAQEKNNAFYVKVNYEFNFPNSWVLDGNVGQRSVKTDVVTKGYGTDPTDPTKKILIPSEGSATYSLPSFNARLRFDSKTQVRAYYGKTMQRIAFSGLNGATVVTNAAQHQAVRGNPDLKPYTSTNYDLSIEHYFGKSNMLYAAVYKKEFAGLPVGVTLVNQSVPGFTGNDWSVGTNYNDPNGSELHGYELGVQMFFDSLPAPFDGLGTQINYTNIESSAVDVNGNNSQIQGQPKSSLNFIAMYEKGPFSGRIAYTWLDKTINKYNQGNGPDYTEGFGVLDASFDYQLNERISLGIEAENLNNHLEPVYRLGSTTNPSILYQSDRRVSVFARFKY